MSNLKDQMIIGMHTQIQRHRDDIAELVKQLSLMTSFYRMNLLDHDVTPNEDTCYNTAIKVLAKHKAHNEN